MKQNRTLGTTLALLGTALAIAVIVWAETDLWNSVRKLKERAERVNSESFHLADPVEAKVRELNDLVFRYSSQPNPAAWAAIDRDAAELQEWLSRNADTPSTARQKVLLRQIAEGLGRFRADLKQQTPGSAATQRQLEAARIGSDAWLAQSLTTIRELRSAERAALGQFLAESQRNMNSLFQKLIISSAILRSMGALLAWLLYQGFIAPLRRTLAETRAILERQEKLSSLGVLAAGVAHEIRNPLTSIKARLFTQQALLEKRSEAMEDNVFIPEEISRLEEIVKDFLAFARPSEPKLTSMKATQPFKDLDGLFRPVLQKANIELKSEFLADPHVQADPQQIKQVLINLVQNAAESIGRDGTITLRTSTRHQPRTKSNNGGLMALLEIEDTGKGIPPDVQKRLFDPFFTTKASGTGLGLSIAARILEKHQGALEYQTTPDRGTLFRVVLPVVAHHDIAAHSTH